MLPSSKSLREEEKKDQNREREGPRDGGSKTDFKGLRRSRKRAGGGDGLQETHRG